MLKTKTLLNAPRVSLHLKYIYLYVCVYIYMHMYMYTYAYIYTHTFWSFFFKFLVFFPFKLMMEEHLSFSCLFLHISNPSLCLVNKRGSSTRLSP